jgi:RNA polymerase sigma-70 factor (family 1)
VQESFYIREFQTGNHEAFAICFDRYYARLCYFARGFLPGSPMVAADLVQDAFERLWERRADFSHEAAIRSFLYVTVKNAFLDLQRHERVVRKYEATHNEEEAITENALERMITAEVLADVHLALQKLPQGCRSVLNLGYFQGLRNEEIARELHVSVNTVKSQKMRAIKLLKAFFARPANTTLPLVLWQLASLLR